MLDEMMTLADKLRQECPLIHHITNYVTVNDCANVVLAVGASPVMAQDINEAEEMVAQARALVLNIGTLQESTVKSMLAAGKRANELSIPVVFDPVGVGATRYRTETARRCLQELKIDLIRCNAGELKALSGGQGAVRGVDSLEAQDGIAEAAEQLALLTGGTVAVTGKIDYIATAGRVLAVHNGDIRLTQITGAGCMTTSLTAAYAAVGGCFAGAAAGVVSMGIAGELAAASLKPHEGIGTFHARLFDVLGNMNDALLSEYARIEEIQRR